MIRVCLLLFLTSFCKHHLKVSNMQNVKSGTRFGMLTTIEVIGVPTFSKKRGNFYNASYAKCVCDCGNEVTVRLDGLKNGNTRSCGCLQRSVAHSQKKVIFNVGVNDYDGNVVEDGKTLPFYDTWRGILTRCYSQKWLNCHPSYVGTTVCREWLHLSNFKKWYDDNCTEGYELDKDILVKGRKHYSPETSCFVPKIINVLFTNSKRTRGDYPIGVTKQCDKFKSRLNRYGKNLTIGLFATPEEAFNAYKKEKEIYIKEIAEKYKDVIADNVYQAMYNYKVEITD